MGSRIRARKGTSAKAGARYPSGRLKPPSAKERAAFERQMMDVELETVKNQPHRKGSDDPLLECAIGRFVYFNKLAKALFDGAMEYHELHRRYAAAWGAPTDVRLGGGGEYDPLSATVRGWGRTIDRCDAVFKLAVGLADQGAFARFQFALSRDEDVPPRYRLAMIAGLRAVAIELQKMDGRLGPFQKDQR